MVLCLCIGRLLLGGDSAHIHSPAGAQGMNTGIQDMINLCWKLAFVIQGQATATLLDTYEADRLPVMRDVLFKTENLTGLIGSENPVVRSLVNHLCPWIAGLDAVQANSTARMSQVALGYRDSSLSSNHPHSGNLHAGDRVPDRAVRHRTENGWADGHVQSLLDPSQIVLLVAHGGEGDTLDLALIEAVSGDNGVTTIVELAPPTEPVELTRYEADFGRRSSVFLVRPDGYVSLAVSARSAARELAAWRGKWLSAKEPTSVG